MKLYGKVLVSNIPKKTTELLVKLCTGFPQKSEMGESEAPKGAEYEESSLPVRAPLKSVPESYIHIFVNKGKWLAIFLETMIKKVPDSSPVIYNTLLELYLKGFVCIILFSFSFLAD